MTADNSCEQQSELISLIKSLVYNFRQLILQHIKLFKEEFKEIASASIISLILLGVAACIAFIAAFFFGVLLIVVFSIFLPVWLAILIVTLLYSIIPIILIIYIANKFKKIAKMQEKNINELEKTKEETKKWWELLKS